MQPQPLPQPPALCHTTPSAERCATTISSGSGYSSVPCSLSRCPSHLHYVTPHPLQDGGPAPVPQVCRIRILWASQRAAATHALNLIPAPSPDILATHKPQKSKRGSRHLKCACRSPPIRKTLCKTCNGGSLCAHGRQKTWCRECGNSARCIHGKQRSKCSDCGGKGLCQHGKVKCRCSHCVTAEWSGL